MSRSVTKRNNSDAVGSLFVDNSLTCYTEGVQRMQVQDGYFSVVADNMDYNPAVGGLHQQVRINMPAVVSLSGVNTGDSMHVIDVDQVDGRVIMGLGSGTAGADDGDFFIGRLKTLSAGGPSGMMVLNTTNYGPQSLNWFRFTPWLTNGNSIQPTTISDYPNGDDSTFKLDSGVYLCNLQLCYPTIQKTTYTTNCGVYFKWGNSLSESQWQSATSAMYSTNFVNGVMDITWVASSPTPFYFGVKATFPTSVPSTAQIVYINSGVYSTSATDSFDSVLMVSRIGDYDPSYGEMPTGCSEELQDEWFEDPETGVTSVNDIAGVMNIVAGSGINVGTDLESNTITISSTVEPAVSFIEEWALDPNSVFMTLNPFSTNGSRRAKHTTTDIHVKSVTVSVDVDYYWYSTPPTFTFYLMTAPASNSLPLDSAYTVAETLTVSMLPSNIDFNNPQGTRFYSTSTSVHCNFIIPGNTMYKIERVLPTETVYSGTANTATTWATSAIYQLTLEGFKS